MCRVGCFAEVGFWASLGNILHKMYMVVLGKMYTAVCKIGSDLGHTKSDRTLSKIGYDFG